MLYIQSFEEENKIGMGDVVKSTGSVPVAIPEVVPGFDINC